MYSTEEQMKIAAQLFPINIEDDFISRTTIYYNNAHYGHVWQKDINLFIDINAHNNDDHHGPLCLACDKGFCLTCDEPTMCTEEL